MTFVRLFSDIKRATCQSSTTLVPNSTTTTTINSSASSVIKCIPFSQVAASGRYKILMLKRFFANVIFKTNQGPG